MGGGGGPRRGARSAALADKDARALGVACKSGARFAEGLDAELAALEEAFASVYANLHRHPETKAFIERIRALKASTHAEPVLSIPSACTGQAPAQASGGAGTAPPPERDLPLHAHQGGLRRPVSRI